MGKNESGKFSEIIKIIRNVEHELADWKYYQAINGKSAIAALFFFFLKFTGDMDGNSGKASGNILDAMKVGLMQEAFISQEFVLAYVQKLISRWGDGGDVLLQYTRRINFEAIPTDFIEVLDEILYFDFCNEIICENFIYAVSALYSSLYDEMGLKSKIHSGELYTIIVAGDLLDCQGGMSIYDFSCGTGGLLAFGGTGDSTVFAQERDFEKSVAAYILLKMLKTEKVYMKVGDIMDGPITLEKGNLLFDRIISAPPVRKKYAANNGLKKMWEDEFEYIYPLQESEFWVYARHMVKKLKNKGRGILIAPISVLSKEGLTKRDRECFLMDGYIEGIVQLPANMSPDINKICLIIFTKRGMMAEGPKVYMADFSSKRGEENIYTDVNELHIDYEKICRIVKNREVITRVSNYIDADIILNNNLNFTPAIYLRDVTELMEHGYKVEEMLAEHEKLIKEYYESETKLNKAIRDYHTLWHKKHK